MTAESDQSAQHLHRQIVQRPHDLDIRAVYADRLEDLGKHQRAEIIRVQLAISNPAGLRFRCGRTASRPWCKDEECHWCVTHRREKQLLHAAHDYAWAVFPAWVKEWRWHNGFPDHLTCNLSDWEKSGPALVTQTPVAQVTISDKEPYRHVEQGETVYAWFCYPGDFYATGRNPDHISADLFSRLPPESINGDNACMFRSRQAAIDALGAAALSQARRDARLIASCSQCQGAGYVSPGKLLPAGGFDCTCPDCQGKGWRSADQ